MEFQVGDIVEFEYDSASDGEAKRTILLLQQVTRWQWKAELMHDSTGNYRTEEDKVFYLESASEAKLVWRQNKDLTA